MVRYGGYPCGLWSLWHSLTISQAATHAGDPRFQIALYKLWLEIGAHCSWACLKVRPVLQECKMDFYPERCWRRCRASLNTFLVAGNAPGEIVLENTQMRSKLTTWTRHFQQAIQDGQAIKEEVMIKLLKNNFFYPSYNFKAKEIRFHQTSSGGNARWRCPLPVESSQQGELNFLLSWSIHNLWSHQKVSEKCTAFI